MKTREELLETIPKNGICVEIGVFEGEFSELIIKTCLPSCMYMVDIFEGMVCSADKNGNNMKWANTSEAYDILHNKYQNKNVLIYKGTSKSFFNTIEDNSIDFIYIDGDHNTYLII